MLFLESVAEHEVKHGQFDQLADSLVDLKTVMLHSKVDKLMQSGELHVKVSSLEDSAFHFEQLLGSVESIAEIDVLLGLKSMDFIVF